MNFNSHGNNVYKKARKHVSALQRLTGVLEWLYTKALLWQISTTVLFSGSLHLDIVLVIWKKIQGKGLANCIERLCVML